MTNTQLSSQSAHAAPPAEPMPVEYHMALTVKKRHPMVGVAAILTLIVSVNVLGFPLGLVVRFLDGTPGRLDITNPGPFFIAANLLNLALLTPISMAIQHLFYGVDFRTLHSVKGKLRSSFLVRAFAWFVPLWLLWLCVSALAGGFGDPSLTWSAPQIVLAFGLIVIATPLQSAGEEYGFRGLIMRVAASWGRGPKSSLILGITVSSVLFASMHLTLDPWKNVFYLTFGLALAIITWRTGGLETAIVMHATNNVLIFLLGLVLQQNPGAAMAPGATTGDPSILISAAFLAIATTVVWVRTRGRVPTGVMSPTQQPVARVQQPGIAPTGR